MFTQQQRFALVLVTASMPICSAQSGAPQNDWNRCISFQTDFALEQYPYRRTRYMATKEAWSILKVCASKRGAVLGTRQKVMAAHIAKQLYDRSQQASNTQD
jgi:hypothetical protein